VSKHVDRFVVYNLRETYHELGEYEFKVVVSPEHYKNSHQCVLHLVDSDGATMQYSVHRWGRKMNCTFKVDESVADGVAQVRMLLSGSDGEFAHNLRFWVVK
jgi:hypothetical protein